MDVTATEEELLQRRAALDAPELCGPGQARVNPIPVKYPDVYALYEEELDSFWSFKKVELDRDPSHYRALPEDQRHALNVVLSWFVCAEEFVGENLVRFVIPRITMPEAKLFLEHQAAVEGIHAVMYGRILETYCQGDRVKRLEIENMVKTMPSVAKKAAWARRWTDPRVGFPENIVAFALVEGLMFATSFALIYWFKKHGQLPGLSQANEYIQRNESNHAKFQCLEYRRYVVRKLPVDRVHAIAREAAAAERDFVEEMMPGGGFLGLGVAFMQQYAEFVCDMWLGLMGVPPIWDHKECPLPFMEFISLESYSNMFERRSTEYRVGAAGAIDFGALPD